MISGYEPWLEKHVPLKGRAFIDVGANTGIWSRWLAPTYTVVHAIEPNPEVVKHLIQNLPANVVVHELAAWSREELLEFNLYRESGHTSAYFKEEGIMTGKPTAKRKFPAKPLSAIVPSEIPVDFIKIDVEGAEFEVLLGAESILAADRPRLIIEVHSPENENRIGPWLAEHGYSVGMIRNPTFPQGSKMWRSHCWLVGSFAEIKVAAVHDHPNQQK